MPPTESRVKINGFAALDTAVGICSPAIKRCVAAPSPEFRCATSFYQRQICEKYLTVPFRQAYRYEYFRFPAFQSGFHRYYTHRYWADSSRPIEILGRISLRIVFDRRVVAGSNLLQQVFPFGVCFRLPC